MSTLTRRKSAASLLNFTSDETGAPGDEEDPHSAAAINKERDTTVWQELPSMILLVVLYMMQGVPLGLTMGSMPFMLSAKASYTQIGIFSIAGYPYSFKLLWSPIVDSFYSSTFGRRKSWIVPLQLLSAAGMVLSSSWVQARFEEADVRSITFMFFFLVLLAATQDIAVDGWALTLLARKHVGYASTCQTIGMNIGYFTSFTVFLAFNDPDFCNTFIRSPASKSTLGMVNLASYLSFWGYAYAIITLAVWFLIKEKFHAHPRVQSGRSLSMPSQESSNEREDSLGIEVGLREAYTQLWGVVKLPAVRNLSIVLVTCRLAMLPAESVAPLKLLEKGVSKEALAGLVLIEFPCELVSALLAGRWSASSSPFKPWQLGYVLRLLAATAATIAVYHFPPSAASLSDHPAAFLGLAMIGLCTSFSSTLMFTSMGNFYNRISDPGMGGAYLTLLNTVANMGVILPKLACYALIDFLSKNTCRSIADDTLLHLQCPQNYQEAKGLNECTASGGECIVERDGFYIASVGMLGVGCVLLVVFHRMLPQLEKMPLDSWRDKTLRKV